ncbi:MAG: hypothetical protein V3V14_09150 [Saprospiraceae bacterium]
MTSQGLKIKIIDIKGSFVSFKYLSSNAKSRIKKDEFISEYEKGVFNVANPAKLEVLNLS